jgi:hypothetical protein
MRLRKTATTTHWFGKSSWPGSSLYVTIQPSPAVIRRSSVNSTRRAFENPHQHRSQRRAGIEPIQLRLIRAQSPRVSLAASFSAAAHRRERAMSRRPPDTTMRDRIKGFYGKSRAACGAAPEPGRVQALARQTDPPAVVTGIQGATERKTYVRAASSVSMLAESGSRVATLTVWPFIFRPDVPDIGYGTE